jgi:hypothetical protein
MKDMKVTKAEDKAEKAKYSEPCSIGGNGDRYPYGLEVRLDRTTLKKLGITSLPKVGSKMTLTAIVLVEEARESQRREGEPDRSVTLQITKMDLTKGVTTSAVDAVSEALENE